LTPAAANDNIIPPPPNPGTPVPSNWRTPGPFQLASDM
jgi:hypothetical protein